MERNRARRGKRALRLLLSLALSLLLSLVVGWIDTPPAIGQFSLPGIQQSDQPPYNVRRLGLIEVTDVRFDGQTLFRIASPTVYNRNEPGSQAPVEVRARQIEANLNQLIAQSPGSFADRALSYSTLLDPETLDVYTETINNQPVLLVEDENLAEPRVLLTVTNADAQYQSTSREQLADEWQDLLESRLRSALESRQPEALRQQVASAVSFLVGTVLLTFVFTGIWTFLGKRQKLLEQQKEAQEAASPITQPHRLDESGEHDGFQWFEQLKQRIGLQRRIQVVRFLRWLLFWAIAFTWIMGISATLYRFPQTRRLAVGLISTPVLILVAWFVVGLINRLADLAIDRSAKAWETSDFLSVETLQRRSLRISTITRVLKGLKAVLLYIVGGILVLQALQIAPVSLLALGAVLALAASFAAQNLVKDLVNGFLILLEDQYAIGDYIFVNQISGVVENLNLRVTQVRSNDGRLITIPNSQITQIENASRLWSRMDYQVEVAYDTDIDKALTIVRQVAEDLAQDPDWSSSILQSQEVLGVEKLSHTGITIRIWIRTQPLKQWIVGREFRRRLKLAFDRHNIHIGVPQQSLIGDWVDRFEQN